MALVCDPRLVQCRRCGARIKLSLKSAYDPCHWQKHRMRCLKKSDEDVRKFKLASGGGDEKVRVGRRVWCQCWPPSNPDGVFQISGLDGRTN